MWNGKKVVDADAHHHEPPYIWDRYVAPDFRDRVPKVIGVRRNFFIYAPDKVIPEHDRSPVPEGQEDYMRDKYGEAYEKWWSPEIRLQDMDRFGWDIQVILS